MSLLDAIHRDPGNQALLSVYADQLLDEGDPHGECIALALRGQDKKARTIWNRHRVRLIGPPLAHVISRPTLRFGFLDEIRLKRGSAASTAEWQEASTAAALQTVRTLSKGWSNNRNYQLFLESKQITSLHTVELHSLRSLQDFAAITPSKVSHIVLTKTPDERIFESLKHSSFSGVHTLSMPLNPPWRHTLLHTTDAPFTTLIITNHRTGVLSDAPLITANRLICGAVGMRRDRSGYVLEVYGYLPDSVVDLHISAVEHMIHGIDLYTPSAQIKHLQLNRAAECRLRYPRLHIEVFDHGFQKTSDTKSSLTLR